MPSRRRPVVVAIAGLPGAGKSTLIQRAATPDAWTVLDTDDLRARARGPLRRRVALYAWHYARILRAVGRDPRVVVHTRGTRPHARRAITALARARGARTVLVLLDAPRPAAEAGQRRRGRVVGRAEMDREARRWRGVLAAAAAGSLRREGWTWVVTLDRRAAARVARLDELCASYSESTSAPMPRPTGRRRPWSAAAATSTPTRTASGPSAS